MFLFFSFFTLFCRSAESYSNTYNIVTYDIEINNGQYLFEFIEKSNSIFFQRRSKNLPSFIGSKISINSGEVQYFDKPLKIAGINAHAFENSEKLEEIVLNIPTLQTIGENAFKNCNNLKLVDLENTAVTYLPKYCFSQCKSLQTIKFPSHLKEISEKCFYFSGISELNTFPQTLSFIRQSAFEHSSLIEIDLSKTKLSIIEFFAFSNCSKLQNFFLPKTIEFIPPFAFSLSNLKDIKIQDHIISLNNSCFSYCKELRKIDLSGTQIQIIEDFAFNGCKSLETVLFPESNSLQTIETFAFSETGVESISFPSNLQTIKTGLFKDSFLLKEVDFSQTNIKQIPEACFLNCYNLEKIVFNNQITLFDSFSFASTKIETIDFPSTLKIISTGAFNNCTLLTSVDFSNLKIKTINNYAFSNCISLKETILPSKIPSFGEFVFSNTGFKKINLDTESAASGIGMYANCKKLHSVDLTNIVVDLVPAQIFENCTHLTNIQWPDFQLALGERSFAGTGIVKLNIPSIISYMNPSTFMNCPNLEKLSLLNIMFDEIPNYAFSNCTNLTLIEFPSSIIRIRNNCFSGCKIKELKIPNCIAKAGDGVFENCYKLETVDFSDSILDVISNNAFRNCINLKQIIWPPISFTLGNSSLANTGFESISLPEILTECGEKLFESCFDLETADLSHIKFNKIPEKFFYKCKKLQTIVWPKSLNHIQFEFGDFALAETSYSEFTINKNIIGCGVGMFKDCYNLSKLIFSNSPCEVIPPYFCTNCINLEEIKIPIDSPIREISDFAFLNCTKLKFFSFESSIHRIGSFSFYGSGLESITFSQNIAEIEAEAFANCKELVSIDLDLAPVALISERCFYNCTKLETIIFSRYYSAILPKAFENCGIKTLEIPKQVSYITPFSFCNCNELSYADLSQFDSSKLHMSIFENCTKLETVILPLNIKQLCKSLFKNTNIKGITLEETIYNIEESLFENCNNLEKIDLSKIHIEIIPNKCFMNCKKLSSVVLPETITSIGSYSFYNTKIEEINFSQSLSVIYSHAFEKTLLRTFSPKYIKEIHDSAFKDSPLDLLTNLNSLRNLNIGSNAFSNTKLSSLEMFSINNINNYAFSGSYVKLINMLNASIKALDITAFENSSIEKIILPLTLQEIKGTAKNANLYYCGINALYGEITAKSITVSTQYSIVKGTKIIESQHCIEEGLQKLETNQIKQEKQNIESRISKKETPKQEPIQQSNQNQEENKLKQSTKQNQQEKIE